MDPLLELTIQRSAITWLQQLGYTYVPGSEQDRDLRKVVLENRLRSFLTETYSELPETVINEAVAAFTQHQGMDVHNRNREFHLKCTKGLAVSWKDKNGKEFARHIYPINYNEPLKNDFLCVDEVTTVGKNKRRPDLILYINGLPLVIFEFKNMWDANATVETAHNQLQHYVLDIPQLFDYNAISIVSDGFLALHGMYNSSFKWFAPWKSLDGDTIQQLDEVQLETLINGLLPKSTLVNYIKNYIFHENHNGKLIKKGAKYHQYWGISAAIERAKINTKPQGDGRLGVIWHTQGSGKSISMAILTGMLRQLPELKNPTIVIQVDRNDLDKQLYGNFILCKDLVGDVQHAESTDELRALLSTDGGGVVFTTIEKFRLKDVLPLNPSPEGETVAGSKDELLKLKEISHPVLSERYNVIVLADEAHRTQYGFNEGGFAQNLRKALPNASFLGFTGTPVDSKDADTELVFGETIHTYDIKQAVEDGATVPIYYEPKLVPLNIKADYSDKLEEVSEENEALNTTVWAAVEDAAGADERVAKIAKEILAHYTNRCEALEGKAMIVAMSRRNCVKIYNAMMQLDNCPEIAVVMTGNIAKDPVDWNPHLRTKDAMEAVKERFKDSNDPLKMVIVRDMWLTGFDAPCIHTMYVDKIMKGHNLMQAIARVNRVFEGKPSGLVVDFIGISGFLAEATKKYTAEGGEGKPTFDIDEAVEMCLAQIDTIKGTIQGLDIEAFKTLDDPAKLKFMASKVNLVLQNDNLTESFLKEERALSDLVAMSKSDERIWPHYEEIALIQKIRETVRKIKYPPGPSRQKIDHIKDLISKSLHANAIVDLAKMYDLDEIDISIIDDQFMAIAKEKGDENIKIELLRRILNDEIRIRTLKNKQQASTLKAELEKVLKKYHSNSIDSIATIKHLLELSKELTEEDKRRKQLGLTEDELAFYDLLSAKSELINQKGPIKDLVHEIVKGMKGKLEIDWTRKESARAAIRLEVKKALKGKVPFSELDNILKEVIEQAEGQYRNWPEVG